MKSDGSPAIERLSTRTNIGNLEIFPSSRYAWVKQILILFFPIMMCLVHSNDQMLSASSCWAHTFCNWVPALWTPADYDQVHIRYYFHPWLI